MGMRRVENRHRKHLVRLMPWAGSFLRVVTSQSCGLRIQASWCSGRAQRRKVLTCPAKQNMTAFNKWGVVPTLSGIKWGHVHAQRTEGTNREEAIRQSKSRRILECSHSHLPMGNKYSASPSIRVQVIPSSKQTWDRNTTSLLPWQPDSPAIFRFNRSLPCERLSDYPKWRHRSYST